MSEHVCSVCGAKAPFGDLTTSDWRCLKHSGFDRPLTSAATLEPFLGFDMAVAFARTKVAHENAVTAWIEANWPTQADPSRCLHCQGLEDRFGAGALVPVGFKKPVWLHRKCVELWRAELRAKAELEVVDHPPVAKGLR
jgi:hypothetical protein